jgi:hypothetical protein
MFKEKKTDETNFDTNPEGLHDEIPAFIQAIAYGDKRYLHYQFTCRL